MMPLYPHALKEIFYYEFKDPFTPVKDRNKSEAFFDVCNFSLIFFTVVQCEFILRVLSHRDIIMSE